MWLFIKLLKYNFITGPVSEDGDAETDLAQSPEDKLFGKRPAAVEMTFPSKRKCL